MQTLSGSRSMQLVSLCESGVTSSSPGEGEADAFHSKTWSCVPNKHPIPFLAPIDQEDICPDRSERWELRTQPFGCDVSTTTSLSVIVSILATLFLMLCIFIVLVLVLRLRRFWRNKPPVKDRWTPTWPSSWRWGPKSQPAEAEHAPLLSPGINH